ncbi:LysR family transcriptional regulator ArgP [Mitsuaria sp. WAJ17]|uniref:LysR family transcriptional regulator ArgP n=1 Tax=Mitsuaria sp. WAJ17 TaxID=2761452 RepID=UPI001602BCFD|nr:LysR family transcriptional regulator ArgP [Mitsuaria sp. WAJ17]MBB2487298.1 LysR family transcriptional regulator ArgP [Mitsuaria sp. WAJ17]
MLDYPLIAALAAVIREGSFEKAARSLHLSPSAISQRVKLLEQRLGEVLVVRDTPCRATPAGLQLCRHAEQVALLERELLASLPQTGRGRPGALRLAVNADSLSTWFIPAAIALSDQDWLLDLSLDDQDHTAERLREGDVLAAVTALAEPLPGCRSLALGCMDYLAVATPAFIARHFAGGLQPGALMRAPCLSYNRRDQLQSRWVRQLTGEGPPLPNHWLPSNDVYLAACRSGMGWGMCPRKLVQAELDHGGLQALSPEPLEVPLYWQAPAQAWALLEPVTQAVVEAARQGLRR